MRKNNSKKQKTDKKVKQLKPKKEQVTKKEKLEKEKLAKVLVAKKIIKEIDFEQQKKKVTEPNKTKTVAPIDLKTLIEASNKDLFTRKIKKKKDNSCAITAAALLTHFSKFKDDAVSVTNILNEIENNKITVTGRTADDSLLGKELLRIIQTNKETKLKENNSKEQAIYNKLVGQYPILSAADERKYISLINSPNQRERDKAIEHLYTYLNKGVSFIDLYHAGQNGLLTAIKHFDPNSKFKFVTYAFPWVRQAMTTKISDYGNIIRIPLHIADLKNKIRLIQEEYINSKLHRYPTNKEIIKELLKQGKLKGIPSDPQREKKWWAEQEADIVKIMRLNAGNTRLDTLMKDNDKMSKADTIIDETNNDPMEIIKKQNRDAQISKLLKEAIYATTQKGDVPESMWALFCLLYHFPDPLYNPYGQKFEIPLIVEKLKKDPIFSKLHFKTNKKNEKKVKDEAWVRDKKDSLLRRLSNCSTEECKERFEKLKTIFQEQKHSKYSSAKNDAGDYDEDDDY